MLARGSSVGTGRKHKPVPKGLTDSETEAEIIGMT